MPEIPAGKARSHNALEEAGPPFPPVGAGMCDPISPGRRSGSTLNRKEFPESHGDFTKRQRDFSQN